MCQPVVLAMGVFTEIAIDTANVYWTNIPGASVMRIAIAGGTPATLASGQDNPTGIDVDGSSVYWANAASSPGTGAIKKIAIGGGTAVTLASALTNPTNVAVDNTSVFWTDSLGHLLMKVSKVGGSTTTLVSDVVAGSPTDLTVDSTNVYWCTGSEVRRISKAGGSFVTLAASQFSGPRGIAVDASNAYWATPLLSSGDIRKTPISGGAYSVLFAPQNKPYRVAVHGNAMYWTSASGVFQAPTAGGVPTQIYNGSAVAIKVDAAAVYFTTSTKLIRLAK
jgi:hypothetical protein